MRPNDPEMTKLQAIEEAVDILVRDADEAFAVAIAEALREQFRPAAPEEWQLRLAQSPDCVLESRPRRAVRPG